MTGEGVADANGQSVRKGSFPSPPCPPGPGRVGEIWLRLSPVEGRFLEQLWQCALPIELWMSNRKTGILVLYMVILHPEARSKIFSCFAFSNICN